MKAVILAAGVGSRLVHLTQHQPKAMVAIHGQPLLLHQIQAFRDAGIHDSDITIVTGHAADVIRAAVPKTVQCLHNSEYAAKNNIYSFWLARELDDDIVLLNCDTYCPRALVADFLTHAPSTSLAIDRERTLGDEEMKVAYDGPALREISKTLPIEKSHGEYIGLARFSREDARIVFHHAELLLTSGRTNVWYEDAIGAAARHGTLIGRYDIDGVPWTEIDTLQDLARAVSLLPRVLEYDRSPSPA